MTESIELVSHISAYTSSGQLALTILLLWRVWRLERKFDNGVNDKIERIKERLQEVKEHCIAQHPRGLNK